jgi:hypothetical protein
MCHSVTGGSVGAQAAGQQVGLRVGVGLVLGELAFVDQALHEGMVGRAAQHLGAAEVVDARIAGVHHPPRGRG